MVSSGYFVKVEDYCLGNSCLKQNGFEAQIDSGSSFTYIPYEAYKLVVAEVLSFLLPFPAAPFSPHSLPFPFNICGLCSLPDGLGDALIFHGSLKNK